METTATQSNITDDSLINKDADTIVDAFNKNQAKKKKRISFKKWLIVIAAIVFVAILMATLVLVLKIDSIIFPARLSGEVLDYAQRPVVEANICIQNKCSLTNSEGEFSIDGLIYGNYYLSAKSTKFKDSEQEITLNRGSNIIQLSLDAIGMGDVSGSLVTEDNLITEDLVITFNEKEVALAADNTFRIEEISTGDYLLEIKSPNYLDMSANVAIVAGSNKLPNITLQPAYDLNITFTDWLSDITLRNLEIDINDAKYMTDVTGSVLITDLALVESFNLKIKATGFNDKQIPLQDITQGLNLPKLVSLTRNGKLVYISERLGYKNIYLANYDGSGEILVTDNKADALNPVFLKNNKLGFLSFKDGLKDDYNNPQGVPYIFDISSQKQAKVANSSVSYYNFNAMRKVFVKNVYESGLSLEEFWVANFDNSNQYRFGVLNSGYSTNFVIPNSGDFVVLSWYSYEANQKGLYYVDLKTKEMRQIYDAGNSSVVVLDISADNKSVIINKVDAVAGNSDIYRVELNTGKSFRITNSSVTEQQARFSKDGRFIYYMSTRDGSTNIYRMDIYGKNEERVTSLGAVTSFMELEDMVITFTNKQALYVVDSSSPINEEKLVTDKVRDDGLAFNPNLYEGYWY